MNRSDGKDRERRGSGGERGGERQGKGEEVEGKGKYKNRGMVILPFIGGISENLTRILKRRKVTTALKPHCTIKNMLVHPKDF